ncbi:MAG TPA: MFS transporter [Chloroflexota bacterium]|nr:MFS transporter [Chloroflexota bacterium]
MVPYNAGAGAVNPLNALFVTQVLGGDVSAVGTLAAATALASVPASGVWGDLTDRLGRRGPFIVLGLLGFGIPVMLMGLSQSLLVAYALSFVMGFLSLAINPASAALLTEGTPRDRWAEAFASFNWIAGVGAIGGLLIGALWMGGVPVVLGTTVALRGLMIFSGALVVVAAGLAAIWLPREKPVPRLPVPRGKPADRSPAALLRLLAAWRTDPWMLYILAYFLGRLSTTLALTPFAVFLKDDLGAPASVVFAAYVANQLFPMLCYGWMGRLLRGTGAVKLMMLVSGGRGLGLLVGALAAVAGAGWVGIGLAFVLYGPIVGLSWAGMAIAGPVAVMEMVPPEKSGRGMGLYNAVASLAGILGAYVSGIAVLSIGYAGLFVISAAVGVVGALPFLLVRSRRP